METVSDPDFRGWERFLYAMMHYFTPVVADFLTSPVKPGVLFPFFGLLHFERNPSAAVCTIE
jgi:hypothetical protein